MGKAATRPSPPAAARQLLRPPWTRARQAPKARPPAPTWGRQKDPLSQQPCAAGAGFESCPLRRRVRWSLQALPRAIVHSRGVEGVLGSGHALQDERITAPGCRRPDATRVTSPVHQDDAAERPKVTKQRGTTAKDSSEGSGGVEKHQCRSVRLGRTHRSHATGRDALVAAARLALQQGVWRATGHRVRGEGGVRGKGQGALPGQRGIHCRWHTCALHRHRQ